MLVSAMNFSARPAISMDAYRLLTHLLPLAKCLPVAAIAGMYYLQTTVALCQTERLRVLRMGYGMLTIETLPHASGSLCACATNRSSYCVADMEFITTSFLAI